MIFMTNITRMEDPRSTVVGMKNTRARRVAMKRKDIYMRDITRSLLSLKLLFSLPLKRSQRNYISPLKLRICFHFRVIMVRIRNAKEVIIIIRKKATNRQRDTIAIMSMMKNTVIKKDTRQGINGQNQIIIETRQNLLLCNRRMHSTYVRYVENFADKLRRYIWSNIEYRVSCASNFLGRLMLTTIILFLSSNEWYTNLTLDFHNYLYKFYLI